jgi:hypothetical protein
MRAGENVLIVENMTTQKIWQQMVLSPIIGYAMPIMNTSVGQDNEYPHIDLPI